jgi:hypothetical protein
MTKLKEKDWRLKERDWSEKTKEIDGSFKNSMRNSFGSHIFQILKSWSLDFSKNQFHFPYFFFPFKMDLVSLLGSLRLYIYIHMYILSFQFIF